MKQDRFRVWNAIRLSELTGLDYNKINQAFRYENSKMITKEESDKIKAEAKKQYNELIKFLDSGRGL